MLFHLVIVSSFSLMYIVFLGMTIDNLYMHSTVGRHWVISSLGLPQIVLLRTFLHMPLWCTEPIGEFGESLYLDNTGS